MTETVSAEPDDAGRAPVAPTPGGSYFPPDRTVPVASDSNQQSMWRAADERGSADGAYAVGVLLAQQGDAEGARQAWERADERGSPDAAYVIGVQLADHDWPAAQAAWRRADDRGSASGAFMMAELAEQCGDAEGARAGWARARHRAETADAAGSADAALVVGGLALREADSARAQSAWERADDRGSGWGALLHCLSLCERGDLSAAEQAAGRGERRGNPVAAYNHGVLLSEDGKYARARRAWRRAAVMARVSGDASTLALARRALHPSLRIWLRTHAGLIIVVALALAALGVFGSWRWAAAGAALAVALIPLRSSVEVGAPISVTPEYDPAVGTSSVSAGALTLFGGVTGDPLPRSNDATNKVMRPATARDKRYTRAACYLPALLAVALMPWILGYLSDTTALRIFYGSLALLILLGAAYRTPDVIANLASYEAVAPRDPWLSFGLVLTPFWFFNSGLRISIRGQHTAELAEWFRSAALPDVAVTRSLRRIAQFLPWLGWILLGTFFATKALISGQHALPMTVLSYAGSIIGIALVMIGVALSICQLVRADIHRNGAILLSALAYLAATTVIIVVAYFLGLVNDWVTIWNAINNL